MASSRWQLPLRRLSTTTSSREIAAQIAGKSSAEAAAPPVPLNKPAWQSQTKLPLPPESSQYVRVPIPPQSSETSLPPVRGFLPTPRPIFGRRGPDFPSKTSEEYLSKTSQPAGPKRLGRGKKSDLTAYHLRAAQSRRVALKQGLTGLWQRKQMMEKATIDRLQIKSQRNTDAAMGPEREVDVLTRSTVRASTAKATSQPQDPERFAKAEASAARTAANEQLQKEMRRDAVTQLYVMARDFIVTEAELQRRVDKLFADDYWSKQGGPGVAGTNIWAIEEAPLTIAGQLNEQTGLRRTKTTNIAYGLGTQSPEQQRTAMKQKIVAEELTGGSLD